MIIRSNALRQNPAYRPGNSLSIRRGILAACALLACHARVPEQAIKPAPAVPPPREPPVPTTWTPRPGALSREFVIENRARVLTTTDSGSVDDSTSIIISASVRHVTGGGLAGLLREIVVSAPGTAPAPMAGATLPSAFAAPETGPGSQYVPTGRPGADPCGPGAHNALGALRDVMIRLPDTLRIGKEWSDSGRYVTCRAGVLLDLSNTRRFRLVGFELRAGSGVLVVTRTATTAVRGYTVRGDDTTRVEGAGASTLRYEIDPSTGDVVEATGTGSLDLVVVGRVRSERAHQTNAVRIGQRAMVPR